MLVAASVLCLFASAVTANGQQPDNPNPDTATLVKGNNTFACNLYGQLSNAEGNYFFSPYSISTALAMTYAGARGDTAAEMAKTLHFPIDQGKLHRTFSEMINDIHGKKANQSYELITANRLWGQKGFTFQPAFLKIANDQYGAGFKEVDFIDESEKARLTINAWVEEQTKQKIKELLKPGILNQDSRIVLTNAIYFKASWTEPFLAQLTKNDEFKLPGGKVISDVPMMHKTLPLGQYVDQDGLKVLAMPYGKKELSMIVLLPKTVDGLPELEKTLVTRGPDYLSELFGKLTDTHVSVVLPKFKLTSQFRLDEKLKALGMRIAFNEILADFSGMTTDDKLHITAVVHQAFVDVYEAGTEAAAATAVVGGGQGGGGPGVKPIEFRADHPFLFLIRDNRTGSILFMGRVMNPQS